MPDQISFPPHLWSGNDGEVGQWTSSSHAMTPASHQSVIAVCHVRTPLDTHPDGSPLRPSIWPVQQRLRVIAFSPVTLRCCNAIKGHATSSPRFLCGNAMHTITTHHTRPQPSTPSLMQEAVVVWLEHLGPAQMWQRGPLLLPPPHADSGTPRRMRCASMAVPALAEEARILLHASIRALSGLRGAPRLPERP